MYIYKISNDYVDKLVYYGLMILDVFFLGMKYRPFSSGLTSLVEYSKKKNAHLAI